MKPVYPITVQSLNKTSTNLNAVFDTGSYYTIIRTDQLPAKTLVYPELQTFRTANKKGGLKIIGKTILKMKIGNKMIEDSVLISDELGSDMLIGAKTMQCWDITILNKKGQTTIIVKHDIRDPEINVVE